MLRHSYEVEKRKVEAVVKQLKLQLFLNPDNQRARESLKKKQKELEWFNNQIKEGKDPGVMIL